MYERRKNMSFTSIIAIIAFLIFVLAVILLITGIRTKSTKRIIGAIILFMMIIAIYFLLVYFVSLM